jgi:hypothetical protein
MNKISLEDFQRLADAFHGEVREDYSGRCMYGKTCIGITVDPCYATKLIEEAAALGIKGSSRDNMGMQMIVYWTGYNVDKIPKFCYDDDEEDYDDGEDIDHAPEQTTVED